MKELGIADGRPPASVRDERLTMTP